MSEKLNIEQLIKSGIGEAEVPPSPGAWKGVRHKLRWKQFVRFYPGKPNIFYLGGILIVGVGTIAILWKSSGNADLTAQSATPVSLNQEENPDQEQPDLDGNSENVMDPDQQMAENPEPSLPVHQQNEKQQVAEPLVDHEEASLAVAEGINEDAASPDQLKKEPTQNIMVPYFTSSLQSGCAPFTVQFTNQSVNSSSCYWTFGTGERINLEDPEYTFMEAGKFTVTLTTEDGKGVSSTIRQIIEVYPAPGAEFEIEEGFEGVDGHVALNMVNYSTDAVSVTWDLVNKSNLETGRWTSNEFQPSIKLKDLYQASDQIRLVVINEYGCTGSFLQPLPVVVESSQLKIKFPNVFSPNPMGPVGGSFSPHEKRTDLFHPLFIEDPLEYNLRIYTRRGELVFGTRDIYEGWDGYFQQERSAGGVYVWMVEGIWDNGEEFKLHGDVTLLWKEIW